MFAAYYAKNYAKHRAAVREGKRTVRQETREQLWAYLEEHPCVDCGETDPVVLEFDHVRGKKVDCVTVLTRQGTRWNKLLSEIAKCDVRCANCHRRITCRRVNDWRTRIRSSTG